MEHDVSRWLLALHEAGHAVAAEVMGVKVHRVRLDFRHNHGGTKHAKVADPFKNAVILWAGAVAEALDQDGPQRPETWVQQPDAQQLTAMDTALVHRALEECQRLVLADHPGAVLALAVLLLERGKVRGRTVREVLLCANELEQEPSLEGDRLPKDYIQNSVY